MTQSVDLPQMFLARQKFPRPRVADLRATVTAELDTVFPQGSIRAGAEIGVTVGSRGITNIVEITRAALDYLKSRDAKPFIIPAMGSHGGAEGEAQRALIAHYGVTEESMDAPIRHEMTTRKLGKSPEGVEVYLAEAAYNSDGILLMNRVKPHTDFKGKIESGLTKICAIGLGKYDGAQEYHSHIFDIGLGRAIVSVTKKVLETGKVLGGLAILENGYHETARLAGVTTDGFFAQEEKLLEEAKALMPALPVGELDVLLCDRMGKNISGAGLDTNITGRNVYGYTQGVPWCEGMTGIYRIVVCDLSEESDGNAVGMGSVDFATQRFADKIDHNVTTVNAVTACCPHNARTPVIRPNDRDALTMALRSVQRRPEGPLVAYIRDTLELERIYLSAACRALIGEDDSIEIMSEPAPLKFDGDGNLVSPFGPPPSVPESAVE